MTSPTRFRRWALATLGVIVGLVLLLVVVGMLLPREHTARASIELAASPERVWAVVSDFAGAARWRPDLESVRLDTAPGRPFRFVETTHEGELPFEVVSQDPPRRQVVRVIDDGLPFGGTWTWELVPLGAGTGLTLTEEGFTRNPIYRALGLVFFRPTESIARYLRALAAELGEDAERLTPREGFATVPRGKVWYRVVGDGPGVPLVVLHGGPGAPSYYLASLARLGAERPVVFYDQLGAGRSDQPSDTTLWRVERFMAELDSLRTHEAAGTFSAPAYQAAVGAFYARFLTRRGGPDVDSTFAHFGAELYGYMWGPSEFTATGALRRYDRTPRLGELRLPVLYTTGEFDEARPATVAWYRSLTPGAEFALIPGSAHLTSVDAPQAFADTVSRFLRSVERR